MNHTKTTQEKAYDVVMKDEIIFNSKATTKHTSVEDSSQLKNDRYDLILDEIQFNSKEKGILDYPDDDYDDIYDSPFVLPSSFLKKRKMKKKKDYPTMKTRIDEAISEHIKDKISEDKNKPVAVKSQKPAKGTPTLEELENAILNELTIICHDGGLYYYNGRSYDTIQNHMDLLSLFRSNVSHDVYGAKNLKFINDLYTFMRNNENLIPKDYEKRLAKSRSLVVLKDIVLDVKTLKHKKFKPKNMVFFELDARWTEETPHTFMKFLNESCDGDEQIIRRVLEVLGCIFSGNNDCKAFFVIGTASNSGKSTLIEFVKKVIRRDYTSSIEPQRLNGRFALGNNRGVILNTAMDIPKGKLNSEVISILKSITGKDEITIEQKYLPTEQLLSNTRFLFGTNFPIKVSETDDDDAFWDRMYIIPFEHSISDDKKDPYLLDKLVEEKDAIVSMCLRAFSKVINNNYRFSDCDAADDMKRKWRKGDESFYSFNLFWNNFVDVTGDKDDYVYSTNLYESYEEYCYSNDFDAISIKEMHKWIENNVNPSKCYPKRTRKGGPNPRMCFIGIRLVED